MIDLFFAYIFPIFACIGGAVVIMLCWAFLVALFEKPSTKTISFKGEPLYRTIPYKNGSCDLEKYVAGEWRFIAWFANERKALNAINRANKPANYYDKNGNKINPNET